MNSNEKRIQHTAASDAGPFRCRTDRAADLSGTVSCHEQRRFLPTRLVAGGVVDGFRHTHPACIALPHAGLWCIVPHL